MEQDCGRPRDILRALPIAALAGVSPELQEAAIVDGASRVQRIWNVDIPAILPTVITMLIFNCASVVSIGFDKVYLMQNSQNEQCFRGYLHLRL